jgi:phosphoribosylamine--glycine ligase
MPGPELTGATPRVTFPPPMKVLVVGNGGREHALVWKIRQSPLVTELYCAPGNAGVAEIADCVPIDASSIVEVADFAQTIKADLTVVGPELPMILGIRDEFVRRDLPIFCPSRGAAEIEGSKAFAREFMARHNIPSPRYAVCGSLEDALAFVDKAPFGYPYAVKADGLAAGKGTALVEKPEEEFLEGEEVSFLVFSDGARVVPMASVQDHKRALDGDQGPNTGGMGTVSPATNLRLDAHKRIMQEIIVPTIAGMASEGRRFQGVLYAGLMMTESGPKVLEFNARFGDPEAQAIMARMRSDIVPLLQQGAAGQLGETRIEWAKEPSCCVVLASRGYPESPETGYAIKGLESLKDWKDVVVYHAATKQDGDEVKTVGGRVLGVTALGANLESAIARAYEAVGHISFEGMFYRKDIGHRALSRLQRPR